MPKCEELYNKLLAKPKCLAKLLGQPSCIFHPVCNTLGTVDAQKKVYFIVNLVNIGAVNTTV
jgi:hypothetical protein